MNENYMHYVWMKKRIPSIQVELSDSRKIDIINFGYYNRSAAGPDFSMGIIHMDGMDHFGPIELHVKSSDWYKHGHDKDPSYNNVILHVVYEHDRDVKQDGRVLPTLVISEYIDAIHKRNFNLYSGHADLICKDSLHLLKPSIERMKETFLGEKLMKKIHVYADQNWNLSSSYYKLLGVSCGYKVNRCAFDELTDRISLRTLCKVDATNRLNFLLSRSGLNVSGYKKLIWESSGFLPAGKPLIRLSQFVKLINYIDPIERLEFLLETNFDQFKNAVRLEEKENQQPKIPLSLIRHTFINAVVPLQFLHAYLKGEDKQKIITQLKELPPESNRITRIWKSHGVELNSAYDSQALIALYNSLCNEKKCLSCEVGKALVKEPNDTEDCFFL